MKLHKLGFAMVIASGLLGSTATFAGNADFTIVNRTGFTMTAVYIAPANKKDWGKERLGENFLLENNRSRVIKFSDRAACVQNMVVFIDQGQKEPTDLTWEDLNLCEINKLTLKYNKAKNEVSFDYE